MNSHLLCCLLGDIVPCHHNLMISLCQINIVILPIWVLYFIMRNCDCDFNTSDALVADETGLSKIYIYVTVVIICKLITENRNIGLQWSIVLWRYN